MEKFYHEFLGLYFENLGTLHLTEAKVEEYWPIEQEHVDKLMKGISRNIYVGRSVLHNLKSAIMIAGRTANIRYKNRSRANQDYRY